MGNELKVDAAVDAAVDATEIAEITVKAEYPVISASKPTVIEGKEEIIYDSWWLKSFTIDNANDPLQAGEITVVLRKYRLLPDGTQELSPVDAPVVVNVRELLHDAIDKDIADFMLLISQYVIKYGQATGAL